MGRSRRLVGMYRGHGNGRQLCDELSLSSGSLQKSNSLPSKQSILHRLESIVFGGHLLRTSGSHYTPWSQDLCFRWHGSVAAAHTCLNRIETHPILVIYYVPTIPIPPLDQQVFGPTGCFDPRGRSLRECPVFGRYQPRNAQHWIQTSAARSVQSCVACWRTEDGLQVLSRFRR